MKSKMYTGVFRSLARLRVLAPMLIVSLLLFSAAKALSSYDETRPQQHVLSAGSGYFADHVIQPSKSVDSSPTLHVVLIVKADAAATPLRLAEQSPIFGAGITLLPSHLIYTQTTSSCL